MVSENTTEIMRGEPNGLLGRGAEPHKIILILAPPGVLSASLIHAVESEFPKMRVEQRPGITAACALIDHPVALILIDVSLLNEAEIAAPQLLHLYPDAIAAIIERNGNQSALHPQNVLKSRLIRGVLPMNLKLDIWLSIIRLMLCGGEYFPSHLFDPHSEQDNRAGRQRDSLPTGASPRTGKPSTAELTAREMQILEMVSRGFQNKLIAAAFSISENTVKIHLHNIIGKLGVYNRTQAAAWFRDRIADTGRGPANLASRTTAGR